MMGASHKNKMALITLSSVFTVGVLAIFISFSDNATASVSTSFVGVQVGGGTLTNPLFGYTPQNVEIKVGSSVVWYVRQAQAEPHTVTFVFDKNTMLNGFLVSNPTVFSPAIIDSTGVTKIYSPNSSLTITGTEKYVNWLDVSKGTTSWKF